MHWQQKAATTHSEARLKMIVLVLPWNTLLACGFSSITTAQRLRLPMQASSRSWESVLITVAVMVYESWRQLTTPCHQIANIKQSTMNSLRAAPKRKNSAINSGKKSSFTWDRWHKKALLSSYLACVIATAQFSDVFLKDLIGWQKPSADNTSASNTGLQVEISLPFTSLGGSFPTSINYVLGINLLCTHRQWLCWTQGFNAQRMRI